MSEPTPGELGRRIESVEAGMRAVGRISGQVARLEARVDMHDGVDQEIRRYVADVKRDLGEQIARTETRLAREIAGVEQACQTFHEEYRDIEASRAQQRGSSRLALGVAIIGGLCVVAASLITAIATVLGG